VKSADIADAAQKMHMATSGTFLCLIGPMPPKIPLLDYITAAIPLFQQQNGVKLLAAPSLNLKVDFSIGPSAPTRSALARWPAPILQLAPNKADAVAEANHPRFDK
jgi:hypothetical protein